MACSNKAAHAFVECGQKTENYGSDVHSYIFRTAEVTYIADGPVKRLRRVKTEKNVLALSLDSEISMNLLAKYLKVFSSLELRHGEKIL